MRKKKRISRYQTGGRPTSEMPWMGRGIANEIRYLSGQPQRLNKVGSPDNFAFQGVGGSYTGMPTFEPPQRGGPMFEGAYGMYTGLPRLSPAQAWRESFMFEGPYNTYSGIPSKGAQSSSGIPTVTLDDAGTNASANAGTAPNAGTGTAPTTSAPAAATAPVNKLATPVNTIGNRKNISINTPTLQDRINAGEFGSFDPSTVNAATPGKSRLDRIMDQVNKVNIGDVMQVGAGLKQFFEFNNPKMQRDPNYRVPYRQINPNAALQSNNANFRAGLTDLNNASPNASNVMRNSLLASKSRADNQVLTDIGNRNQQMAANTDRFNLQQARMTSDYNMRNQAAYDNSRQVANESLSHAGQALSALGTNRRAVRMLLQAYPDIAPFMNVN